ICHGVLDKIEGCNAASCSDCQQSRKPERKQKSRFCYLCLSPHATSQAAHACARNHSGNYWDQRDGHTGLVPAHGQPYQEVDQLGEPYRYGDRYHWLIARENLEPLFHSGIDPAVRDHALQELEPMLKERKMWPIPVEKDPTVWSNEVNHHF